MASERRHVDSFARRDKSTVSIHNIGVLSRLQDHRGLPQAAMVWILLTGLANHQCCLRYHAAMALMPDSVLPEWGERRREDGSKQDLS